MQKTSSVRFFIQSLVFTLQAIKIMVKQHLQQEVFLTAEHSVMFLAVGAARHVIYKNSIQLAPAYEI